KEKGKSVITPVIFTSGETLTLNKDNETVDHTTEGIFTFN
ncbi:MAG: PTS glucose transporter subunit IIA, partial [Erysipelothrix sp.]|nr:PTS glucose transporter subunit IIA [Erysipelothrix sp.]